MAKKLPERVTKKESPKVEQTLRRPAAQSQAAGKTRPVRIELTEEMHALLDRVLRSCGDPSRAAYFRGLLLEDARRRGLLSDKEAR